MKLIDDWVEFSGHSWKKAIVTVLTNPCFHSVCLFRLSNFFYKAHLSFLAKIIWYINRIIFCVDIDYRADLAGGLVIKHGLGIVIGKGVITKGNITIYQGVTLGGNSGIKKQYQGIMIDQPYIEENVTIYTDAKIFGPVVIGKNNIIKAGSILTDDLTAYEEKK